MKELIFDTTNLVIMRDKNEEIFYAIDSKKFTEARAEVFDKSQSADCNNNSVHYPELETIILVEKEPGKFDLGNMRKFVSYETMKGVLISTN